MRLHSSMFAPTQLTVSAPIGMFPVAAGHGVQQPAVRAHAGGLSGRGLRRRELHRGGGPGTAKPQRQRPHGQPADRVCAHRVRDAAHRHLCHRLHAVPGQVRHITAVKCPQECPFTAWISGDSASMQSMRSSSLRDRRSTSLPPACTTLMARCVLRCLSASGFYAEGLHPSEYVLFMCKMGMHGGSAGGATKRIVWYCSSHSVLHAASSALTYASSTWELCHHRAHSDDLNGPAACLRSLKRVNS